MNRQLFLRFSLVAAAIIIAGCTPKSDSHSGEKSFKDSVAQLVSIRNNIRDCIAAGDLDGAHGPLHEVGHVLEHVAKQVTGESFSEGDVASVKAATEELLDAFGEVDKTFHGGEGAPYEDMSDKIDAAVKTITDIASVDNPPAPKSDGAEAGSENAGDTSVPGASDEPVDATGSGGR